MKSLFAIFSLVLAAAAPQYLSNLKTDFPGGADPWCETTLVNTSCDGSYIGSTGCGVFSVPRWATTGTATVLQSKAAGFLNCSTFLDNANVGCAALAEQKVLPSFVCRQHELGLPW